MDYGTSEGNISFKVKRRLYKLCGNFFNNNSRDIDCLHTGDNSLHTGDDSYGDKLYINFCQKAVKLFGYPEELL